MFAGERVSRGVEKREEEYRQRIFVAGPRDVIKYHEGNRNKGSMQNNMHRLTYFIKVSINFFELCEDLTKAFPKRKYIVPNSQK